MLFAHAVLCHWARLCCTFVGTQDDIRERAYLLGLQLENLHRCPVLPICMLEDPKLIEFARTLDIKQPTDLSYNIPLDMTILGYICDEVNACKTYAETEEFIVRLRYLDIPESIKESLHSHAFHKGWLLLGDETAARIKAAEKKRHAVYGVLFNNGLLKIGKSTNVVARLNQLSSCNAGRKLAAVYAYVDDCGKTERAAHTFFSANRAHGEYFSLTMDQFKAYLDSKGIEWTDAQS